MDQLGTRLQSWFATQPEFAGARPIGIQVFSGGASNITCRVDVVGGPAKRVVLRMQKDEGIFAPYDVVREGRVLAALEGTPLQVPRVLASEPDPSHLGAPFLILEYIDGLHMGEPGVDADFGAYVQAVVDIHSLDWRSLDLEFLRESTDAAGAVQLEIEAVAGRMNLFGCGSDGLFNEALAALRRTVPTDGELSLCQGDINVFNYLFREGTLVGVVDWEQARLSDSRGDVGQIVALSHLKGAPFCPPRETGFVEAYEADSGGAVQGLEWFRAFWLFQLGVIYHGWVAFNDSMPWYTRPEVDVLLKQALAEIA